MNFPGCVCGCREPSILLIFYQALFRFAAAMECINLADQIAYHQKVGNNKGKT